MFEPMEPQRIVAILPLAVEKELATPEQANLCRGIACYLNLRLGRLMGVETLLRTIVISTDTDMGNKGWLINDTLWTIDQLRSLPLGPEDDATHLLQGQASWVDDQFRLTLELIDLEAEESLFKETAEGNAAESLDDFYQLIGMAGHALGGSVSAGRLVARDPTRSHKAMRHYLLGLAAIQAWHHEMSSATDAMEHLCAAIEADGDFLLANEALESTALSAWEDENEDAAKVEELLERAIKSGADYPRFKARLGLYRSEKTDPKNATELLREFLHCERTGRLASEALTTLAELHGRERHSEPARRYLEMAVTADPENAVAWETLGQVNHASGNPARAEDCWRRALQEDPDRVGALQNFSRIYFERGDYKQARVLLGRVRDLDRSDDTTGSMLVESLMKLGDYDKADEIATERVELLEESFDNWNQLGRVRLAMGDRTAARYCAEKASELVLRDEARRENRKLFLAIDRPGDVETLDHIRESFQRTETLTEQEIRDLERLSRIEDCAEEVLPILVNVFEKQERVDESITAQERYCALQKTDASAFEKLASMMERDGRIDDAISTLTHTCALDENSPSPWGMLAECFARQDRLTEAIVSIEEAISRAEDPRSYRRTLFDLKLRSIRKNSRPAKPGVPSIAELEKPEGGVLRRIVNFINRIGFRI